jgi:hypothetical protein
LEQVIETQTILQPAGHLLLQGEWVQLLKWETKTWEKIAQRVVVIVKLAAVIMSQVTLLDLGMILKLR